MEGVILLVGMIVGAVFGGWGIADLLKLAFSRGFGIGIVCLIFPFLFLGFLGTEEGLKAWGKISLGFIGFVVVFMISA